MRLIMTFFLGWIGLGLCAQSTWIEERKLFPKASDAASSYGLERLYRSVVYDYKFSESGDFICDVTYHQIFRANNDEGLESVNRIYIPMGSVIEILDVKSRTISNDGRVLELDQKNIKEVKDEEENSGYKIFAVEGAEVGGEIEYFYTKRVSGSTFINENIQFDSPVREFQFTLICPENLEFDFKTANYNREVEKTDTTDAFNKYEIRIEDIPAFVNEDFSGSAANKMRIDFKAAYNSGGRRLNTYADAGKNIYEQAVNLTKSEEKLLSEFIKEFDKPGKDPLTRFKHLEHEVKIRYYEEDYVPDNLDYLFDNGFADQKAFLKLFVGIAAHLGLDYEIVATADRFKARFDPEFDSWNFLDAFLLFFPEYDSFMSVSSYSHRFGFVPVRFTATHGIFIHPEMVTDFLYPITRIDYIPELGYEKDMNNLFIQVMFNVSEGSNTVTAKRIFNGEGANYYKSVLYWMDEESKEEMLTELVEYLAPDAEVEHLEIEEANNTPKTWDGPFIVSTSFETKSYLERAGNSILFKIGDLIGAQSEMYQENERQFDVENGNNRGYYREIVVDIPKGYEVQNPGDVIINEQVVNEDGKPIFGFISSYAIEKGKLKVIINEFYDQIYYPKEKFEEFKNVINAAADWNKVVLVLKKA